MIDVIQEKIEKIIDHFNKLKMMHQQMSSFGVDLPKEEPEQLIMYCYLHLSEDEVTYMLNNLDKILEYDCVPLYNLLYNHKDITDQQKMLIKLSVPDVRDF